MRQKTKVVEFVCRLCGRNMTAAPGAKSYCGHCGRKNFAPQLYTSVTTTLVRPYIPPPAAPPQPRSPDKVKMSVEPDEVGVGCDKCLRVYRARPATLAECPGCGHQQRSEAEPDDGSWKSVPTWNEQVMAFTSVQADKPSVTFFCPTCGMQLVGQASSRTDCHNCGYATTAPLRSDYTRRISPEEYQRQKHAGIQVLVGVGVALTGVMAVGLVVWGIGSLPKPADPPLSDDRRIERMEREKRELMETNEWMRKKAMADQWDRQKGR